MIAAWSRVIDHVADACWQARRTRDFGPIFLHPIDFAIWARRSGTKLELDENNHLCCTVWPEEGATVRVYEDANASRISNPPGRDT